jgi:hypothetical protein
VVCGSTRVIIATPPGFAQHPDSATFRSVTVAANTTTMATAFVLVPIPIGTGAITGHVLDGTAAVANVRIEAVGFTEDTTKFYGGYLLNGLRADSVLLRIHLPTGWQLATGQLPERKVAVTPNIASTVDWQVRALATTAAARQP